MKVSTNLNEKELLQGMQAGDQYAFETLYHYYSKRIYWKFLRMVKVENEVEELLQDLFIKVWERREQIDIEQSFQSYLYRIAENIVYDFYRKAARDRSLHEAIKNSTSEIDNHTLEKIQGNEIQNLVDQAISNLPPKRQEVFILCRIEGKSYQEAAEILGISVNTVRNHLVKASQTIKEHLADSQSTFLPILLLAALASLN